MPILYSSYEQRKSTLLRLARVGALVLCFGLAALPPAMAQCTPGGSPGYDFTFTADAPSVPYSGGTTLRWSSVGISCTPSSNVPVSGWIGPFGPTGQQTVTSMTQDVTFGLTCGGSTAGGCKNVKVTVFTPTPSPATPNPPRPRPTLAPAPGYGMNTAGLPPRKREKMQELGARFARSGFDWNQLEPLAKGQWNKRCAIDPFHVSIADAHANGIEILAGLGYTPCWASGHACPAVTDPCAITDAANLYKTALEENQGYMPKDQDWYDFAYFMAREFRDEVHYWNIWNEANDDFFLKGEGSGPARQLFREARYMHLVEIAHRAIRDADPAGARVLGPEFSTRALTEDSGDSFRRVMAGVGHLFDIVTIHWYPPADWAFGQPLGLGPIMDSADSISGGKPMWLTEVGLDTPDGNRQADLYRSVLQVYAEPGRENWQETLFYNLDGWAHFSIVVNNPNDGIDQDLSLNRPAFYEYQQWIRDHPRAGAPIVPTITSRARDSEFVSQEVAATMLPGQTQFVHITVQNRGTQSWTPVGSACNSYRLAPTGATTWGTPRVDFANPLPAGQQVELSFSVTAPSEPGTYEFQWRMLQECGTSFGPLSPVVWIKVASTMPVEPTATPTPTPTPTPTTSPTPTATATPFLGNVLFLMGASGGNMSADDAAQKDHLTARGYSVIPFYACSAGTGDAAGKVLVIIGSTSDPDCVGTTFRPVAVPVLVSKAAMLPNMGMTSSSDWGSATSQTQVTIVDPTSPLAGNLSGTVVVETAAANYFAWGRPSTAGLKVASVVGDSTKSTIFAYAKGAMMPGGGAPACRVGAFWATGSPSRFNANGWTLFDAAVDWATRAVCR